MAEFKNLTSQIEVIDSPFSGSISYHQKSANGVVQLGVGADNGEVVLFKIDAGGNVGTEIARYKFSEVTTPLLVSIDLLVEQINTWINDEPISITVDSIFTDGLSGVNGLTVSNNYVFKSDINAVIINDDLFDYCFSIFNDTIGKMLYIKGSESYTGSITSNEVCFDINPLGMTNDDVLYITFKENVIDNTEAKLQTIIDELKLNNKILTKIYQ